MAWKQGHVVAGIPGGCGLRYEVVIRTAGRSRSAGGCGWPCRIRTRSRVSRLSSGSMTRGRGRSTRRGTGARRRCDSRAV